VYLVGEATGLLQAAFAEVRETEGASSVPVPRAMGHLEAAVRAASEAARPGDVVILAPACASFDQYTCFEERGEHFATLVRRLAEEKA
jgi:UDP-N-acetylmuramoylalanine--D-glutamate ligase